MFAKDLKDVKTDLKASLKQASDHVNILFEYTFHVPSSYIDKDKNFIEQEFMRLKHELTGTSPQDTAKKGTRYSSFRWQSFLTEQTNCKIFEVK